MILSAMAAAQQAADRRPLSSSSARREGTSSPTTTRPSSEQKAFKASSLHALFPDAPPTYGLLITFSCSSTRSDSTSTRASTCCRMELVPDQYLASIHPNAYGPSSLVQNELRTLTGGGSGVCVFKGTDLRLGNLVMKHGGHRDTKELFALATIAQELQRRGARRKENDDDDDNLDDASQDMLSRLPEFKMLYISPCHLKDKPKDLWRALYKAATSIRFRNDNAVDTVTSSTASGATTNSGSGEEHSHHSELSGGGGGERIENTRTNAVAGKRICLYTTTTSARGNAVQFHVRPRQADVVLGSDVSVQVDHDDNEEDPLGYALEYGNGEDNLGGYDRLKLFLDKLISKQKRYLWKFTMGQKTIGGPSPKTAFSYLATGKLEGDLLDTLIDQYLQVIHNLQALTLPCERNIIEKVQKEVEAIETDVFARPFDVSDDLDAFVGFALKKNYDPETGRIYVLHRMGKSFRCNEYKLTEQEVFPGKLLGKVLPEGTQMGEVFQGMGAIPCALDLLSATKGKYDPWRAMVRAATNVRSPNGLQRVWNCGIADGGLHNLFLDSDKVWLFDLGEPTLQPLPALLTKFLFSFLHSLGMVDDNSTGSWTNRFEPSEGNKKVALTTETCTLMTKAYHAFKVALDCLIKKLFNGEEAIRSLLIKYVTFQLVSDAAFCLNKWSVKGGGRPRGDNHQTNLEKWLWRSLWDLYIASDLNTKKRFQELGVRSASS